MRDKYNIAVVTNDIYTREDAEFLTPLVRASLAVMGEDTRRMRKGRPFTSTNLKEGTGLRPVINFIIEHGMPDAR